MGRPRDYYHFARIQRAAQLADQRRAERDPIIEHYRQLAEQERHAREAAEASAQLWRRMATMTFKRPSSGSC